MNFVDKLYVGIALGNIIATNIMILFVLIDIKKILKEKMKTITVSLLDSFK